MEGADLVRPRRDGGSLFAEAVAAGGHGGRLLDERPDADAEAALSDEGLRELRLAVLGISALQARRKGVVFGQEPQKVPANRLGHVEHDRAGDLVVPNLVKAVFFSLHTPAVFPAGEDVDALPVPLPARRRLVQAAGPRDPVPRPVFDDAGLFVEDALVGHGPAPGVARNRHLYLQVPMGDHPRQQLEGVCVLGTGRRGKRTGQPPLH